MSKISIPSIKHLKLLVKANNVIEIARIFVSAIHVIQNAIVDSVALNHRHEHELRLINGIICHGAFTRKYEFILEEIVPLEEMSVDDFVASFSGA